MSASAETSGTSRHEVLLQVHATLDCAGTTPACQLGSPQNAETPPPPAPDCAPLELLQLLFHTLSAGGGPGLLSDVPPTPVT